MKKSRYRLLVVFGAAALVFGGQNLAAQSPPPGNGVGNQDRIRSQERLHDPGTANPAYQMKRQLRSGKTSGSQTSASGIGAGRGGTTAGQGGKKYGPGDGTGNQGVGPRDGSGYGPGTGTMPQSGMQRRGQNRRR